MNDIGPKIIAGGFATAMLSLLLAMSHLILVVAGVFDHGQMPAPFAIGMVVGLWGILIGVVVTYFTHR